MKATSTACGNRAACWFLLLVPLGGFLFFCKLADRDLWSSHEARAAMDAQSIVDTGALVPRLFDGQFELQKPPLFYWFVAVIAHWRGDVVDAWAVRLPAALAALGCVGLLAALGWRCGQPRAGLLAGVVLATAAHFTWLARIGRIDMPLTLTTTVAASAAYLALRRPACSARFLLLIGYLAAAVGILLKGPIGLVLPASAIVAFLLLEGEWPAIWEGRAWLALLNRLGVWWGVPLTVALALPWFLAANEDTDGALFRVFFWYHNVARGLGGAQLRANPWWFYVPQFIVDFLPWSPLVVAGIAGAMRGHWLRDDALARFGLAWFVGVLVVLSCAQFKRADYLLPAYPGAALFLGCALARARGRLVRVGMPAALAGAMVVVWAVRIEFVLPAQEPFRDYRPLAALIRARAPAPTEIVFFRTEAHALAFRVGQPLAVLVEWRDLEARVSRPGLHFVVTPPECAAECRQCLPRVRWAAVASTTELAGGSHERPLLLLQAEPADDVAKVDQPRTP